MSNPVVQLPTACHVKCVSCDRLKNQGTAVAVAAVEVWVQGMKFRISGITVRRADEGRYTISVPHYRNQKTNEYEPALEMRPELLAGIQRAVKERLVEDGHAVVRPAASFLRVPFAHRRVGAA
jgi:hypothetical protein